MTTIAFYKKILPGAAALLLLLTSCNKQLDLLPTDDIVDPAKAYQNVKDVNAGLMGAYNALNYYSSIFYTTRITDEVMLPSENSTGSGVATYRWQYDGAFQHDAWYDNYKGIDRANRVLGVIDNIPTRGDETALKAQYKGELLAVRAYCHFELIRNFASGYSADSMGVPYMERSEISTPSRPSFSATMAKINADLVAAKDLIPADFHDNTRITKLAVSAIQARVALYEKNWDKAIDYATEAINGLPLASRTAFPLMWHAEAAGEVFWKLKRVTSDAETPLGNLYTQASFLTNPAGSRVYYAASYELTNLFDQANDIRFSSYIVIDPGRVTAGKTPNVVIKYTNNGPGNRNLVDIKLFRTGEMYLIRSEAYAEDNQLQLAEDDLNDLRATRITGYTPQSFAGKEAIIEAIQTERFKELAFEGHRHHDLRRWNLPITRLPEDAVNALGAVLLPPTRAQYIWPIPNSELRANKNLKQNPRY